MTQKTERIMSNEEENVQHVKKSSPLSKSELNMLLEDALATLQLVGAYVPQYSILDNGAVYFYKDMPSAELQRFIEAIKNDEGY
jgi:hypothetical protein